MHTGPITSLQNLKVKEAFKLRTGRQRAKQGRIIIDGVRETARALAAGVAVLELFVCDDAPRGDVEVELAAAVQRSGGEVFRVSRQVMEKLAYGDRSAEVVAVAAAPQRKLADIRLPSDALVVVLEGLEKPGNVGAIVRTADGAGAHAVVVTGAQTDLYNPNAIRASLGTVFTVSLCAATPEEAIAWCQEHDLQIITARVDAAEDYTSVDYRRATALVLGGEAQGLSAAWSAGAIRAVRLPMRGAADSLNVSATAAVLCYEARRQRK